jgi:phage baseplate assembly protein V
VSSSKSRGADKRYYGVVEALVTEVDDPEREGRVKVQYPWFDDQTVSDWCRVRQLYAGPGYGTFFVPEVGDEVLVAFVHGDMRLPIVLGGLYNGQDKPPVHREGETDPKLIRTKGGHEVLLDDTASARKVHVKSAAGHEVVLDDAGSKVTIKTPSGQSIELDAASGSVTMTGVTVTVDASQVKLGGAGAVQPLVLGTAFMALFNAHVHTSSVPTTPTSPPLTPMTPAVLSTVTKTS